MLVGDCKNINVNENEMALKVLKSRLSYVRMDSFPLFRLPEQAQIISDVSSFDRTRQIYK